VAGIAGGDGDVRDGVRTTAELLAAGLSPYRIRRLVREGSLQPLLTGVYAATKLVAAMSGDGRATDRPGGAGQPADEHLLHVAAALAATGWRAVGSHRSAALAHGLGLVWSQSPGLVEITRSPEDRGSRTGRPGVRVHAAAVAADHVVRRRGIPLTTVARTVIDLARTQPFAAGVAVADSALHDRKVSRAELDAVLEYCQQWPGVQRARCVVAFSDPRAESVLESIGRVAFHEFGLPQPDLQVWIGDDDEVIGRVDYLWREFQTIAEADGAVKYTTQARAMAQLNRDARLRAAGYQVVHFTWAEITRVPGQVAATVGAAFRQSAMMRNPGRTVRPD